jgi:hypothetical protein
MYHLFNGLYNTLGEIDRPWGEIVKKDATPRVNVRLDEALSKRLAHVCVDRGVSKQAAAVEAIELWVSAAEGHEAKAPEAQRPVSAPGGVMVPPEFGSLTPEETDKLLAVLEFMRNPERVSPEFRSILGVALESIIHAMRSEGDG